MPEGGGRIAVGSGAYEGPFTLRARIDDVERSTNPEELIGAASAGCFTMSLANLLTEDGHPPADLQTKARVRLEQTDDRASRSPASTLQTVGDVPGVDAERVRGAGRAGQGHLPGVAGARRHRDHAGGEACKLTLTRRPDAWSGAGTLARTDVGYSSGSCPRCEPATCESAGATGEAEEAAVRARGQTATLALAGNRLRARARVGRVPRARRRSTSFDNPGPEARLRGRFRLGSRRPGAPSEADARRRRRRAGRPPRSPTRRSSRPPTQREFRIVADPSTGLRSATHFVGYIPTERAPDHFHTYDEVIYVLEGEGTCTPAATATAVAAGRASSCRHAPCIAWRTPATTSMRLVAVFRPAGSPAAAYYPDGTPAYPGRRRS